MIWIEILGPSGIGKSYWYQKFILKYPKYEPKQLVLKRIYESEDLRILPLKIRFMFYIYRMDLYKLSNHFKHKLFNYFLKGFLKKYKSVITEKDDLIIKKFLESIDALGEPQIVVLKKICYFHKKLIEFKFYEFYLHQEDVYIAEDGLMHLSANHIKELQPDSIFIFRTDVNNLLQQRLQRAKSTPATFIEFLLNEKELINYIKDVFNLYNKKTNSIIQSSKSKQTVIINLNTANVIEEMINGVKEINKKEDKVPFNGI